MGMLSKGLPKLMIAALLVATLAMNPKPLRGSPQTRHLKLSEKSKTGAEGSNIQVNCSVSMAQPLEELKWELSEDDKSNVKQLKISETKVALIITSLKRTNAGQYSCLLIMPDGAEEKEEFSLLVQQEKDEVCAKYQFKCEKTRNCLFIRYRCDNMDDCGDGSDEQCDVDPCLNKFRCNNSRCIEHKFVCDHVKHCEDYSDEQNCNVRARPTSTALPVGDDNTYAWLQITVSSFIAVTLGLVFFISFIVIMVFRNRVRRLREQRIARALEQMYQEDERLNRHGVGMGGPGDLHTSNQGQASDQQQFLLGHPHPHYGNIIVNVNNGVQYIPGYDYAIMMDIPPPYSEVGTTQSGEANPPPPAYSTLEHQRMSGNGSHDSAQPTQTSESVPCRQPLLAERCATVPASDVCCDEPTSRPNNKPHQTSSPNRSVCDTSGNTQTLPSGIDINSHFLQSLLSPHLQTHDAERNLTLTTGNSESLTPMQRRSDLPNGPHVQESEVSIVYLTASPRHRGGSSPSAQRNFVGHGEQTSTDPYTQPGHQRLSDGQSMLVIHNDTVLPSASGCLESSGRTDEDHSDDDCTQSLLKHEPQSASEREAHAMTEQEEDANVVVSQNEDSTFLLRKPKNKAEVIVPQPSPSSKGRGVEDASNALSKEVSKRDDRLCPKPGHLTVQDGEILLHTPTGILTDTAQVLPSQQSHTPLAAAALVPTEAPELTIQNGALVFGSPNQEQPIHQDSQSQNPSRGSVVNASHTEPELFSHPPESSSLSLPQHDAAAAMAAAPSPSNNQNEMSDTLHRKELQFKNGELVLESPKHTPSTQILSHLKGAYAEEEGMAEAIEPVVNTKRSGGSATAKSQTQKINSDVVLPPKTYQQ